MCFKKSDGNFPVIPNVASEIIFYFIFFHKPLNTKEILSRFDRNKCIHLRNKQTGQIELFRKQKVTRAYLCDGNFHVVMPPAFLKLTQIINTLVGKCWQQSDDVYDFPD